MSPAVVFTAGLDIDVFVLYNLRMAIKRHFFNLLRWVTPSQSMRHKLRVFANYDTDACIDFVRKNCGIKNPTIKTHTGWGAKNLVVVADDAVVFKFPLVRRRYDAPIRERRMIDAFVGPDIARTMKFGDANVLVYPFVRGCVMTDLPRDIVRANAAKIGAGLGRRIFEMGRRDPAELADLKPQDARAPGFMYGWFHNDIGGNFIINPKTMDFVGFIDWESAQYCDFRGDFRRAFRHMWRRGYGDVIKHAAYEYCRLWRDAAARHH